MKRLIAAAFAVALLAVPVEGQFEDGFTDGATSRSTLVQYNGNTPYFTWSVDFDGDGLGASNWDFLCVDQQRYVSPGREYSMVLFSLGGDLLPTVIPGLSYDIDGLRRAALLYDEIERQGLEGEAYAQQAVWYVNGTGTRTYDQLSQASRDLVAYAENASLAGLSFENYFLMLNRSNMDYIASEDRWVWTAQSGGAQPQLTRTGRVSVPEPGTFLLLASGLVGVFFVRRRREGESRA